PVPGRISSIRVYVQPFCRRLDMRRKPKHGRIARPKKRFGLRDLDQSKTAVIGSLRSPEAQRGYRHAIEEFIEWYCSEPRLSFSKSVVLRYPHTPRISASCARNRKSPPRYGAPPRLRGFRLQSAKPRPRRRNTTREGGQEDRCPARQLANARTVRETLELTRLSASER